ncbi:hypothetical protein ACFFYR_33505 [Paraburkholderia dipogonis]|uniref:hypothetical protein n=1 Tax=Paraburkholderia dipogonis TaxID=1211383 RepID=UPI0035EC7028
MARLPTEYERPARGRRSVFADMNTLLRDSPVIDNYLFVDRVHFNDKGYDEVAGLIADKVL